MVMMKVMQILLFGLLACTPAIATVQYCADDISQGAQFCVSMVTFQTDIIHGVDLYLTIELLNRPGIGWIAFGIGDRMAESLMFIVLTDKTGETIVTTRTTSGHFTPEYNANILPLGKLISTKTVREGWRQISLVCSSCNVWDNFQPDSQNHPWIWARNSYVPVERADEKLNLQMHDSLGFFYVNMTGAYANPSQPVAPPPVDASRGSYGASLNPLNIELTQQKPPSRLARDWHGPLLGTAFMILFPAGAIVPRLKRSNWFWIHTILQMLASLVCIVGVTLQATYLGVNGMWHKMNNAHILVGALLALFIFLQLFLGYWHHVKFSRSHKKTKVTSLHIWNGRLMLAVGILNTGLGLELANRSNMAIYAWSLLAVFEVIFLSLVVPCIERRVSVPTTNISVSQAKDEFDEAAARLLESADEDF